LVLQWHVLPPTAKELRVWLDVGHGGDETGCTALDGSLEKNWNLKAAHLLKQQLLQAGVGHVHLGRHGDTTQSLTQRVEALEASACHISLSLHFNALPCGRDPMAHEGLGVYYYQPWAWAWASNLLKAASQTGLRVDSVFENNLALTRPSGCVALLVEFGYLIHPHTLEALLEPNSQLLEQWAQALTHGLITQFEAAAAKASP
jgi:N-acetylmuramoyl-L-alanine amidase